MNAKLEKEIISTAYGDAGLLTKIKIYFLAKRNSDIQKLLREHSATAGKVRALKKEHRNEMPKNLKLELAAYPGEEKGLLSVLSYLLNKPALKYAVSAAVIAVATLFVFNANNEPEYTEAEIKLAEKQIKQTLVFVGETFSKASRNLEREIIPERIGKPFSQSATIVKDLLTGGNKNEKLN